MNVDDLVARAQSKLSAEPLVAKSVLLDDEMVSIRFKRITGSEWRDLTAQHLPRAGSFIDQNLGYDIDGVLRAFPGVTIETGDGVDDLRRPDDSGGFTYVWPVVCAALDSPALEILTQTLYEMHQLEPQQAMIAAGKALRAGRAKKRG